MRRLFARARPSVIGLAAIAVLSLVGSAVANQAIRDNSINTRDIKDNQVNTRDLRNGTITTRDVRDNQINTRDLRDGALRGVDIHDGSIERADLSSEVSGLLGAGSLYDPRAHGEDNNLSWAKGPAAISAVVPKGTADPLPSVFHGQAWRVVVLDPGTYVVQTTAYASDAVAGSEGVASRLFFAGKPLVDGTGYGLAPATGGPLSTPASMSTVLEVPAGQPAARQLVERVAAVGGVSTFRDDFLIAKVAPR
jgi:hypothetical protein